MSIQNIDKGYIGIDTSPGTSSYVTLPITFRQPYTMSVNATFMKKDGICVMTLPPVMGLPATSGQVTIIGTLPDEYHGIIKGEHALFIYIASYSVLGTNPGTYPGYISIVEETILFRTTGQFIAGSVPQGLPNSTTIIYLTDL